MLSTSDLSSEWPTSDFNEIGLPAGRYYAQIVGVDIDYSKNKQAPVRQAIFDLLVNPDDPIQYQHRFDLEGSFAWMGKSQAKALNSPDDRSLFGEHIEQLVNDIFIVEVKEYAKKSKAGIETGEIGKRVNFVVDEDMMREFHNRKGS